MTDIKILTNLLSNIYGAVVLPENESRRWLEEGEDLIIGYAFPDQKKAYYLLTISNLRFLTKEQREFYVERRLFPFEDMKVIVYKDKGGDIVYRTTGGIAGELDNLFDAWSNWAE